MSWLGLTDVPSGLSKKECGYIAYAVCRHLNRKVVIHDTNCLSLRPKGVHSLLEHAAPQPVSSKGNHHKSGEG
jgi:hypothetical protein